MVGRGNTALIIIIVLKFLLPFSKVTRTESGSNKYSPAQAGGAWDGGNISGTDIGEVIIKVKVM